MIAAGARGVEPAWSGRAGGSVERLPEAGDRAGEAGQQRRGQRAGVGQRGDQRQRLAGAAVDGDGVGTPVDQPVLVDALARVEL
jgi:hypothetical protein